MLQRYNRRGGIKWQVRKNEKKIDEGIYLTPRYRKHLQTSKLAAVPKVLRG
jgi:hypothetical protein